MSTGFHIEPLQPQDEAFILDSWLRSYDPGTAASPVERARYYRNQRVVAERCMREGSVAVAVVDGTDRQLAGWVCWASNQQAREWTLHFVYVKNLFRGHDVGTALIERAFMLRPPDGSFQVNTGTMDYTHDTPSWRGLMRGLARRHPQFTWRHHVEAKAEASASGDTARPPEAA